MSRSLRAITSTHEIRRRFTRPLLLFTLLAACTDKDPKQQPASSNAAGKSDTSAASMKDMKDMPGMSDSSKSEVGTIPNSVNFTAEQVKHGAVAWNAVKMGVAPGTTSLPGEIIPNEDQTSRLGAPARGRIVTVSVRPGDHVSRGQPLITLLSPDAGMAQSDVAKSDAEVLSRRSEAQYAATARARAERLLQLKAIPQQDYERAIADDERAKAALSQADAESLRSHKTAEQLDAATAMNGEIVLRSPAAGVVLARTAVPGTVVDAGAPLVVVSNLQSLWLSVNAPEQMVSQFHRNDRLQFTVTAFPFDTFTARVDAVGAGLEPETRTLSVRAVIANTIRLKPQMLANVQVNSSNVAAVLVPDEAVQLMQGKSYVFFVMPDDKGGAHFEKREVSLGARSGGHIAIVKGLASGDVVVTAGSFAVKADFLKGTMPKMEM